MGLRARLLLAFLLPTWLVLALGGTLLYGASRNVLEDELGTSLSRVAAAISAQLRADRVLSLTASDAQGEGSRTFRSLSAQLEESRRRAALRRILVVDARGRAFLDIGGSLPILSEAPELMRDRLELERVFAGDRAASQVLFEDSDGVFYKTGYAPLVQDGKVLGAVAVEGSAAFFGPLARLKVASFGLLAITSLLLAVAAMVVGLRLSRPLERLVGSALRMGRGDLLTPVLAEGPKEVRILARELELMRQALESRDRQLKLMLGGVAHEVKNPLGGIELFGGLLAEGLAAPVPDVTEAREHVKRIQRELEYLKRIVDDFLAFAREQKVQQSRFEDAALLEAAATLLSADALNQNVELKVHPAHVTVTGDVSLLTSALVNLVKNAIQVSSPGKVVSLRGRKEAENYVVEVADAGPGIESQTLPHIFEPFFTTREKGTGLGLALARKIIEAHRGTLSCTSKPGETIFCVRLPLEAQA